MTATNVEDALTELADAINADNDNDPTNELSDLELTGNLLTLTNAEAGATGVDLSAFLDNTDDQTATEVSIADAGNLFTATTVEEALTELASSNANDNDTDPTNELSDLTLSGNLLLLTNTFPDAVGVDLSPYLDNTDDQNATEVSIIDAANHFTGSSVEEALTELATANANDNDTDSTNELSDLDLTNNVLTLTNAESGATGVNLSSYLDNTDDQTIDEFSLTNGSLSLSLEADAEAPKTINLISADAGNDITYGSDGGLYLNMPKIASTGKIGGNGTALSIYGASVSRIDEGDYQVTFNSPLANAHYIIQLTILDCGGDCPGNTTANYDNPSITYYDQTPSGFKVNIGDSDNGTIEKDDIDLEFMYTIITLP